MDYNIIRKQEKGNKNIALITVIIIAGIAILITAAIITYTLIADNNNKNNTPDASSLIVETAAPTVEPIIEPTIEPTPIVETVAPVLPRRGTAEPIPPDIREYMMGKSMKTNNDISFDNLSYLTIPHYDFNGNIATGHMVVNAVLAEEVLDIFADLFDIQYPIERMELVDKYGADDYTSIEYNNTSAFNYRRSTDGSGRLSKHALGRAIDINPQINPYVTSDGTGSHSNAREYWSRNYKNWSSEVAKRAYIGPEAEIYNIFVNKYGWEWGGSWSSYRDYQHFQKFN